MRTTLVILLGLLVFFLQFFTSTPPVQASDCSAGASSYDVNASTTIDEIRIYLQNKSSLGTARYQGDTIEICLWTDAASVTIDWQFDGGITVETDVALGTDSHPTFLVPETYTGGACPSVCASVSPVRIQMSDASGTADQTDFFFFVGPVLPTVNNATTTLDLIYTVQPQYAIAGQIYNPVFNTALPTDGTATQNFYYPNKALNEDVGIVPALPGLYANDATVASQGSTPANSNQWALFYWWFKTSEEPPDWTITLETSTGLTPTGATVGIDDLLVLQGTTFTQNQNREGYIAIVIDRTVSDFANSGFFFELCPTCTTAARDHFGVWKPLSSGTYQNGSTSISTILNGGYLQVVEDIDQVIIIPGSLTINTNYRSSGDAIIAGDVVFFERVNNSGVDYRADLVNVQGIIAQSLLIANTDGITLARLPFAFWISAVAADLVIIREDTDSRLPAIRIIFENSATTNRLITSAQDDTAIVTYVESLTDEPTDRTSVLDAFNDFAVAWGLTSADGSSGPGTFLIAIIVLGVLTIGFLRFLPSTVGVGLLVIMVATMLTLVGLLQAWVLMLALFMIGIAILWQVVIRGA